jgi:hypothetical protein
MRTDTQRLDWVLAALDSGNNEPIERLQAAYTLELRGRAALDAAMGAKLIEPGEPMPALTAIDMAVAELGRIRNVKGFSEERDDRYVDGELVNAAVCYLLGATEVVPLSLGESADLWPWDREFFKPSPDDRKKELTKGIALALCELDRLIRAERRAPVTVGVDLANGPDQCVVDGVLQPQLREFKVGDRVKCNDPSYSFGIGALGTIIEGECGSWGVKVDASGCDSLYFFESELEHADD